MKDYNLGLILKILRIWLKGVLRCLGIKRRENQLDFRTRTRLLLPEGEGLQWTLMTGILFASYTEYPGTLFTLNVSWTRLFTQFRVTSTKQPIVPHKETWLHQV